MQPGDLPIPVPLTPEQQAQKNRTNLIIVAVIFALMALCCLGSRQSQEDIDREFQKTLEWERKRGIYK
jgi:hypothetical protein